VHFIDLEDGLDDIDVHSRCDKRLRSTQEIVNELTWCINNPSEYDTLGVDTADWMESIICKEVANEAGKETIEELGWGKGWQKVNDRWRFFFDGFNRVIELGKHVVFTAHAKIAKFKNPAGDGYDYFSPAIHEEKETGCLLVQWCTEVLYMTTKVYTVTKDKEGNRTIGVGGTERVIYTTETPSHVAKNRLGLPSEISFDQFIESIPKLPQAGNIAGIVNNGSSKQLQQ
jgi:hypothetical protein